MAEKSRRCPACGGEMSFRLGTLECAQCGRIDEPLQPAATTPSGPGLKRSESWQTKGSIAMPQPGTAAPTYASAARDNGLDAQASVAEPSAGRRVFISFQFEKGLYIVAQSIISVFGIVFAYSITNEVSIDPITGFGTEHVFFAIVITEILRVVFTIYALQAVTAGVKYTCGGFLVLGFISAAVGIVSLISHASEPTSGSMPVILQVIQLIINIWLFTLLYRDISLVQAGE